VHKRVCTGARSDPVASRACACALADTILADTFSLLGLVSNVSVGAPAQFLPASPKELDTIWSGMSFNLVNVAAVESTELGTIVWPAAHTAKVVACSAKSAPFSEH
jgi:hypothetical protein